MLSRIIILLLAVGTQSCLAWILGPGERGSFAVCQLFAVILNLFFVMGLEVSSIYFVSSKKCSLSEGVISIFAYGGISSFLAIIAGCVAIQFNFAYFHKASHLSFFLALLTIPTSLLASSLILLLTAVNEFKWFAIVSVADGIFLLLFTILFVMIGRFGVNGALTAVFIQGFLSTIVTLLFLTKRHGIYFVKPSVMRLTEMFYYGVRFHIGKASNLVNIHMGTMMAAIFLTKEDVGSFAIASQIIIRIMVIPDTLTTVLLPKVASKWNDMSRDIAKLTRITGVITSITLVLFVLMAKPIVMILFSPAFLPAVPIIQILAIGITIRGPSKIFEPYLLGVGWPGRVSISSVVTLITNIILAVLFLSWWGLTGVAIGTSLAYFCGAYVLLLGFKKHSSLKYGAIFRFKQSDFSLLFDLIKSKRARV